VALPLQVDQAIDPFWGRWLFLERLRGFFSGRGRYPSCHHD